MPDDLTPGIRLSLQQLPFDGGRMAWRGVAAAPTAAPGRPPLVLFHGGHGSWAHWARNLQALSQQRQVWVADLPGYGDSDAPAAPTWDALLTATQQSLDALLGPAAPIALAGFSFGGLVAAHLAARRGAVACLALLGPAGHGGPRRPRGELRAWRDAWASGDAAALRDTMRHNLQVHMLAGPVDDEAVAIHTQACVRTRFHSKTISRAGGLRAALSQLTCPVLLAWGEHDVTATPALLAPALAAACPQAQTHTVPGAGHWVQYEAAEAINALLNTWLADRDTMVPTPRAPRI